MKRVQLVYNPTAGDEDHDKDQLIELLKNAGYTVYFVSTDDENWEASLIEKPEIIYAAGGDGTVHKVTEALLKNEDINTEVPIRILPLGTANNIAKTLGIDHNKIPETIKEGTRFKAFDCGNINGLGKERFFIESLGLGIFPKLILKMKNEEIKRTPSEKLKYTHTVLKHLIDTYKPTESTIKIDGEIIKDSFLLVEVMNIKYLGPNLELAPNANPGDSYFDLVLIREHSRKKFSKYIDNLNKNKNNDIDLGHFTETRRVRSLSIWNSNANLHVDDEVIENQSDAEIIIENIPGKFKM